MIESGCLLAQQSIETYLKAIAHATNQFGTKLYYFAKKEDTSQGGKTRIWGHDLTELIRALIADNPGLNVLLFDNQMNDFLKELTESYEPMRYGEATHSAQFEVLAQQLDKVVQILDSIYHTKMSLKTETKLYVPSSLRDDFLRENKVFPEPKITGFSMANLVPGVDISALEGKINFNKPRVRQAASAATSNKKESTGAK
jgi:hypothetical protein